MSVNATLRYMLADFTPYMQEFAKVDSVANICCQIATEHNLIYGRDFSVGEMGMDGTGAQWVKIDFKQEELAMIVRLRGLMTVKGITK